MTNQSDRLRLERQFDSFCKKVLRNEARDYYKAQKRRLKHEISLDSLTPEEFAKLITMDRYSFNDNTFTVLGEKVIIENEWLADALQTLSKNHQEIILLAYLFQLNDREISELIAVRRRSVQRIRVKSLKTLHDFLLEV